MNRTTIIGNLTRDPEMRTVKTSDGNVSVCDFTVAANGRKHASEPTYFRCTAWRGVADLIGKYCSKGKKVCVTGQVSAHAYVDKNGAPQAAINLTVEDFEFCSPRGEAYDNDLKDDGFTRVDYEDVPF